MSLRPAVDEFWGQPDGAAVSVLEQKSVRARWRKAAGLE